MRRRVRDGVRERRRVLVTAAVLGTVAVLIYPYIRPHLGLLYNPAELRAFVEGFGQLAPLVFFILMAAQVLIAPVPGGVFGVAGGLLFGTLQGTIILMAGLAVGTALAVYMSRRWGRPLVELLVAEETMDRFDSFSEEYGMVAFAMFMLLPGFPDDPIILIAGLTDLDFRWLVFYGIVLRLPAMTALALTGDSLVIYGLKEFLILALALVVMAAFAVHHRNRIIEYVRERAEG